MVRRAQNERLLVRRKCIPPRPGRAGARYDGGMNTLIPLSVAAELGIPCVDADGMRRAFPQVEMTTFTLHGRRTR